MANGGLANVTIGSHMKRPSLVPGIVAYPSNPRIQKVKTEDQKVKIIIDYLASMKSVWVMWDPVSNKIYFVLISLFLLLYSPGSPA